jgi:hypothetical protein
MRLRAPNIFQVVLSILVALLLFSMFGAVMSAYKRQNYLNQRQSHQTFESWVAVTGKTNVTYEDWRRLAINKMLPVVDNQN